MKLIELTSLDISITALLVVALAFTSYRAGIGVEKQLMISAFRCTIQLLLIGYALKAVFAYAHIGWILLIAFVMLAVAAWEVMSRQKQRLTGWWGFGAGAFSMFISSFTLTLFALTAIIKIKPWYTPQYSIPLLGMMFGNTMNGIAVSMDRLTSESFRQRDVIEARLSLGQKWQEAISHIQKDCIRSGLIPIINSMASAGIVSLPGMMTGQILAGSPPAEAIKYQILIMFLIAAGTGFGVMTAVWIGARRLFDSRERLRLDRLYKTK
jgi:putative ABC transport system permease protein